MYLIGFGYYSAVTRVYRSDFTAGFCVLAGLHQKILHSVHTDNPRVAASADGVRKRGGFARLAARVDLGKIGRVFEYRAADNRHFEFFVGGYDRIFALAFHGRSPDLYRSEVCRVCRGAADIEEHRGIEHAVRIRVSRENGSRVLSVFAERHRKVESQRLAVGKFRAFVHARFLVERAANVAERFFAHAEVAYESVVVQIELIAHSRIVNRFEIYVVGRHSEIIGYGCIFGKIFPVLKRRGNAAAFHIFRNGQFGKLNFVPEMVFRPRKILVGRRSFKTYVV